VSWAHPGSHSIRRWSSSAPACRPGSRGSSGRWSAASSTFWLAGSRTSRRTSPAAGRLRNLPRTPSRIGATASRWTAHWCLSSADRDRARGRRSPDRGGRDRGGSSWRRGERSQRGETQVSGTRPTAPQVPGSGGFTGQSDHPAVASTSPSCTRGQDCQAVTPEGFGKRIEEVELNVGDHLRCPSDRDFAQ